MSKTKKQQKYIFVTGGVVSSLGKGIIAASLGTLLEHRGLTVTIQKFDPYLNIDPGTMSPHQHGEVYVLPDGAETDLDLGHYERFTNASFSKLNNLTSGQVFSQVLQKERDGKYLGKTVQFIPHCTDEIKARINEISASNRDTDIIITEIGGTTGDIEGHLFLEAIRQFKHDIGAENCVFIHVTLLPYISVAGESKTKPTQQSVAKLREIGIQPDIIVCRMENAHELTEESKKKIALFCNLQSSHVVAFGNLPSSIYEGPLALRQDKLDRLVCDSLQLTTQPSNLDKWKEFVSHILHPEHVVRVGVIGKYMEIPDAYKSIHEAFVHAGANHLTKVIKVPIDAEKITEENVEEYLKNLDGILVPGGFGERAVEGKIMAVSYARQNKLPFLGICLGMQIAIIEFARNVCQLKQAHSQEFVEDTPHPVICLQQEQEAVVLKGGTMHLGDSLINLQANSLAEKSYQSLQITERHRHRYQCNPDYEEQLKAAGLIISGVSDSKQFVEVVELAEHPFFIACQFHPEFKSRPYGPHPLFSSFIKAALQKS